MNRIEEYLAQYGVSISREQLGMFEKYMRTLQQFNEHTNLTAITDDEGIIEKHFIDSLSILNIINKEKLGEQLSMVDIGAGAGFPGLPIKIVFPTISLTLVDSVQKKVKFLSEISQALNLKDTICIASRAENVGIDPSKREAFDIAVARAVSETRVLVEYLLPLVKIGGVIVLYKGGNCEVELAAAKHAIKLLGGEIKEIKKFKIGENGRSLILIEKLRASPKGYPRKEGLPARKPL